MPENDTTAAADESATEDAVATATPERPLPENPVLRSVVEAFDDLEWMSSSGQDVVLVPKDRMAEVAGAFKEAGYELLADVTAVDYLGKKRIRFEVVVNLVSVQHGQRIRIRCAVPADDPSVPSVVTHYPGANFFEREVYDMFGISFEGHPDMTRILMPDDWVGHPLRKDFSVGAVPVQFKDANKVT